MLNLESVVKPAEVSVGPVASGTLFQEFLVRGSSTLGVNGVANIIKQAENTNLKYIQHNKEIYNRGVNERRDREKEGGRDEENEEERKHMRQCRLFACVCFGGVFPYFSFNELAHDLIVKILDRSPLDAFFHVLLLFRFQC